LAPPRVTYDGVPLAIANFRIDDFVQQLPRWEEYLALAVDEIRLYGVNTLQRFQPEKRWRWCPVDEILAQ
jgi:hypothetical protein